MFVHIVDEEIYLKLIDKNDATRLFELTDGSRCHLRKWLPWLDFTNSIDDTERFIQESRQSYASHKNMNTVIVYKDVIVGVAGFNEFDWSNKAASIGYWISQDYEGKGIMTRTVKALTGFAFTELGLHRVEIRAASGNQRSRAIPERLGYTHEGTLREAEWLYDHFVDHTIYGMLATEWKA